MKPDINKENITGFNLQWMCIMLNVNIMSKQEPQFGLEVRCMLGNMHKIAAPSGLQSGYFMGP